MRLLRRVLVKWKNIKQNVVARSGMDVEHIDTSHGICEMLCLKRILDKSGMPINMWKLAEI
jgi:hypothetical protein